MQPHCKGEFLSLPELDFYHVLQIKLPILLSEYQFPKDKKHMVNLVVVSLIQLVFLPDVEDLYLVISEAFSTEDAYLDKFRNIIYITDQVQLNVTR